jgi:hypothetical protein
MRPGDEIPGMDGLCWSDLPLDDDQIEDLRMSGAFDSDEIGGGASDGGE